MAPNSTARIGQQPAVVPLPERAVLVQRDAQPVARSGAPKHCATHGSVSKARRAWSSRIVK